MSDCKDEVDLELLFKELTEAATDENDSPLAAIYLIQALQHEVNTNRTRQENAMSHHSKDVNGSPLAEELRHELGATGGFPEGKLNKHDEGAIQFAIGVKDGKVIVDFGKPVVWVGMNPGDALALAESLIQRARQAAKGGGSIITLNL